MILFQKKLFNIFYMCYVYTNMQSYIYINKYTDKDSYIYAYIIH